MTWLLIIVIVLICYWLYGKYVSPTPEYPPLETDPDDPLLLEAMEQAKSSFSEFRQLFDKYPDDAFVKLCFESNTGTIEHLGAHVESISGDKLEVVLVTPPVTHKGHLDRCYTCLFEDLEDWQITDIEGNIYGGFTQRAMFQIAENQRVELPKELMEMKSRYV